MNILFIYSVTTFRQTVYLHNLLSMLESVCGDVTLVNVRKDLSTLDNYDFSSVDVVILFNKQALVYFPVPAHRKVTTVYVVAASEIHTEYHSSWTICDKIIVLEDETIEQWVYPPELVTLLSPFYLMGRTLPLLVDERGSVGSVLFAIEEEQIGGPLLGAVIYSANKLVSDYGLEVTILTRKKVNADLLNLGIKAKAYSSYHSFQKAIDHFISQSDIVIGNGWPAFKAVLDKKPVLVIGNKGYGGRVVPANVTRFARLLFSGRVGGECNEYIPVKMLMEEIGELTYHSAESGSSELEQCRALLVEHISLQQQGVASVLKEALANFRACQAELHLETLKLSTDIGIKSLGPGRWIAFRKATSTFLYELGEEEMQVLSAFFKGRKPSELLTSTAYESGTDNVLELVRQLYEERSLICTRT